MAWRMLLEFMKYFFTAIGGAERFHYCHREFFWSPPPQVERRMSKTEITEAIRYLLQFDMRHCSEGFTGDEAGFIVFRKYIRMHPYYLAKFETHCSQACRSSVAFETTMIL